jgi:hypothetical protein
VRYILNIPKDYLEFLDEFEAIFETAFVAIFETAFVAIFETAFEAIFETALARESGPFRE